MTKKSPAKNVEDLIAEIRAKCVGGHFVFRGTTRVHSDAKDGVNSSLYRWAKGAINQYYKPSDIEKEIVEKARKHFPAQTSNIEILTVLRHYGGRVNLIDFSRNLYVALFFACNRKFGEDGEITLVDTDKCAKLKEIDYDELAKNSGSLGIIEPSQIQESRARAAVQGSVFLYSSDGYINKTLFTRHTIPHGLKEDVLNHIEEFNNITIDTIYNDIIGFISNEKNYETAAMYFYRGNKERISENYEKAIHCYDEAIKINPQYADAYLNRGNAKAKLGNHKEALQDFDKVIEINRKYAIAYFNRGNAKAKLGNHKDAIQDFDKAIEINNQHAKAFNNRGNAKAKLGNHKDAIQDYGKAIEINPQDAKPYNNCGIAKAELGNHKEALQDFDKALEINPQYAESYFNRGIAKAKSGNLKDAIQDFDKAIKINNQYANAYFNRGAAKAKLGNLKDAIADFDKALEINPQYAESYFNRGVAKAKLGNHKDAIQDFDKAIAINPQDSVPYRIRGLVKQHMGDEAGAKEDFAMYDKLTKSQNGNNSPSTTAE